MSFEDITSRLESVRRTSNATAIARCPAHEDRSPSLSVKDVGDGRTLVHCHAGCSPQEVIDALGVGWSVLYPPTGADTRRKFTKAAMSAMDALRCLEHEALIVYLAAGEVIAGKTLTEQDRDRLLTAASRMRRAREVCGA